MTNFDRLCILIAVGWGAASGRVIFAGFLIATAACWCLVWVAATEPPFGLRWLQVSVHVAALIAISRAVWRGTVRP